MIIMISNVSMVLDFNIMNTIPKKECYRMDGHWKMDIQKTFRNQKSAKLFQNEVLYVYFSYIYSFHTPYLVF